MNKISLIILSRTDSQSIFSMNLECMDTFIKSANLASVDFEVILVESSRVAKYDYSISNLKIVTPKAEFNFHKFLNIGIANATGDYYVLSNNDVVFESNWLVEVLRVAQNNISIKSFSPYDPKANKLALDSVKKNDYILGYKIQKHLTGWCIIMHQSVFKTIKKLDDRFLFYYADNDYAMQLQKYNIKHALVTKAIVHHLESVNSKTTNTEKSPTPLNKRLPKYIIKENWIWVIGNDKMEKGLIQFHDKWGSRRLVKLKLKIASLFSNIGLGFLNRVILFHS